jgi:N-acetylglucosaminyl-diphospho-decaprenol L-rhamnosyltransferase
MLLSVVVVHYRSLAVLPRCLEALSQQTAGLETELVVVDNDSRDGLPDWLAREHPAARAIVNPANLGYAKAVNQGIAATRGDFVLVMNPDVYLAPGALATLLGHLRDHPETALVAPQLRNPDGTIEFSARSFPGAWTFLFNRYSLLTRLWPGNRWSRGYLLSDWDRREARAVDWVSGACMMVRRSAVQEAGGMDEGFFMFNEDVDWCRRLRQAGWQVVCEPRAQAVHDVGASRGRVAAKVIVERHRGMIRYFHKHYPTNPLIAALAGGMILLRAALMLARNALLPRER